MSHADLPLLLLMPVLLAASALFSGSETALFSLTYSERRSLRRISPRAHASVTAMLSRPRDLLITVLLLNMTVNVAYFVVLGVLSMRAGPVAGGAINIAGLVLIILIGEVLAKLAADAHRTRVCAQVGPAIFILARVVAPIRLLIDRGAVEPLSRLIRPADRHHPATVTAEELSALLGVGVQEGAIEEEEQLLLAEVIELGSLRVREVMRPRSRVPWVDVDADLDQLKAKVIESGQTLLPVCAGGPDAGVLGFVDATSVLCDRAERTGVSDSIESALFIPEAATLDNVLLQMRAAGARAAVCVDEYGAVAGLVRLEDVLDELVPAPSGGSATADQQVRPVGPSRWSAPGRLSVRDWAQLFDAEPANLGPGGRVSTLAGLMLVHLGRLAREGDRVNVGNVALTVEQVRGRAIERVLIELSGTGGDDS